MTTTKTPKPCANRECQKNYAALEHYRDSCESYRNLAVNDGKALERVTQQLRVEEMKAYAFGWCFMALSFLFALTIIFTLRVK
jgi:hypothetical protein